jgi:membrane protein required for colicin V production
MSTYTWLDYLVIVIFILSMLVGLKRGFIKEGISLATIIAAFFIAITFSGSLANWLNNLAGAQSVARSLAHFFGESNATNALSLIILGLSFFVLFLLTMVIGEIINKMASGAALIPGLGLIDRLLGAGFGVVRGFLMNVVVLFLLGLTPVAQGNAWTQSQWLPTFGPSIAWLSNIVKPGLQIIKEKVGGALENINSKQSNGTYNGTAN